MNKLIAFGMTVSLITGLTGLSRAIELSEALTCLSEIKTVCSGLEADLELCLKSRSDRLSSPCSTWLKTAMEMAANNPGTTACMADIKLHCPGSDASEMTQCVTAKKAQFSPECQKYLGNAPPPTSPIHVAQ